MCCLNGYFHHNDNIFFPNSQFWMQIVSKVGRFPDSFCDPMWLYQWFVPSNKSFALFDRPLFSLNWLNV